MDLIELLRILIHLSLLPTNSPKLYTKEKRKKLLRLWICSYDSSAVHWDYLAQISVNLKTTTPAFGTKQNHSGFPSKYKAPFDVPCLLFVEKLKSPRPLWVTKKQAQVVNDKAIKSQIQYLMHILELFYRYYYCHQKEKPNCMIARL